jgi:hypothetical protein
MSKKRPTVTTNCVADKGHAVAEVLRDVQADGGDVAAMLAECDALIDWAQSVKAQLQELET